MDLQRSISLLKEEEKKQEAILEGIRHAIGLLEGSVVIRNSIAHAAVGKTHTFYGGGEAVPKKEAIDIIADIIQTADRFLSKNEIEALAGKPIPGISDTLSRAKRDEKRDIVSYSHSGAQKHTVWGFSRFLDEKGIPIMKHAHPHYGFEIYL